jgi:hypothetical protein
VTIRKQIEIIEPALDSVWEDNGYGHDVTVVRLFTEKKFRRIEVRRKFSVGVSYGDDDSVSEITHLVMRLSRFLRQYRPLGTERSTERNALANAAGFAFPHPQGATLVMPQKWSCPNCGGDCFGSVNMPPTWTYYCQGKSLGTKTEQTPGCGYWETAYEPRRQGIKPR